MSALIGTRTSNGIESLPDDVLVAIGLYVANVLGPKDFVRFSMVSKRIKALLMDSPTTISEVIRLRTSEVKRLLAESGNAPTTTTTTPHIQLVSAPLPPLRHHPWLPVELRSLEELSFFECFYDSYFEYRYKYTSQLRVLAQRNTLYDIVSSVLRAFPSATVVLDSHCSNDTMDYIDPLAQSNFNGFSIMSYLHKKGIPRDSIGYRAWGENVDRQGPSPDHFLVVDHHSLQNQLRLWIEFYVRLPRKGNRKPLELPPRPAYYEGISMNPKLELY